MTDSLAAEKNLNAYDLSRYGGSTTQEWNASIIAATAAAVWPVARKADGSSPKKVTIDEVAAAKAGLSALAPADEVDGLLAALLIGAHTAAMEAFRRGAHPAGDDVSSALTQATELGRLTLDALHALDQRRAGRKAEPAPKSEMKPEAAGAPSADQPVPPPPPPPKAPWPTSEIRLDPAANLSDEQLRAFGGYRTAPERDGVGAEAAKSVTSADPVQSTIDAELRAFGYRDVRSGEALPTTPEPDPTAF